jgi:hypothetical protein
MGGSAETIDDEREYLALGCIPDAVLFKELSRRPKFWEWLSLGLEAHRISQFYPKDGAKRGEAGFGSTGKA